MKLGFFPFICCFRFQFISLIFASFLNRFRICTTVIYALINEPVFRKLGTWKATLHALQWMSLRLKEFAGIGSAFTLLSDAFSMDDGELDPSSHLLMSNSDLSSSFDEFLRNTRTCTHTHTCNPPGHDAATHTHTCYHTHTQVFATSDGERGEEEIKKPRKPLGNREAVRKYREKKKAHAAYLEEEVKKLRMINQQLLKRLQGQAALETEVVRLRSLLVDVRAKIDAELGVYPFQKPCAGADLQCNENAQCIGGNTEVVGWDGSCMPAIVDCQINPDGDTRQNLEILKAVNSMDGKV